LGTNLTLTQIVLDLKDTDNKPFFTSIKPTKISEEEGHYLLLTTKDQCIKAMKKLSNLQMA
jgi:hypothetical protein